MDEEILGAEQEFELTSNSNPSLILGSDCNAQQQRFNEIVMALQEIILE